MHADPMGSRVPTDVCNMSAESGFGARIHRWFVVIAATAPTQFRFRHAQPRAIEISLGPALTIEISAGPA
jgi:hypothetical protein